MMHRLIALTLLGMASGGIASATSISSLFQGTFTEDDRVELLSFTADGSTGVTIQSTDTPGALLIRPRLPQEAFLRMQSYSMTLARRSPRTVVVIAGSPASIPLLWNATIPIYPSLHWRPEPTHWLWLNTTTRRTTHCSPMQVAYVVPGNGTNFGSAVTLTVGSSASQG